MRGTDLAKQCYRASSVLLARFGWSLLSAEELARRAESGLSLLGAGLGEEAIRRAVFREYCLEMYRACGDDGGVGQQLAFRELSAYLYPIVRRKTSDKELAREMTQQALVKVWHKLGQCKYPACFLYWAEMIVIRELLQEIRRQKTAVGGGEDEGKRRRWREVSLSDLQSDEETEDDYRLERLLADKKEGGPMAAIVRRENEGRLVAALRRALCSEMQYRVVVGLFIEEKGLLELAEELGTRPTNIHTIKSRAISRLRDDVDFLETLADLLEGGG